MIDKSFQKLFSQNSLKQYDFKKISTSEVGILKYKNICYLFFSKLKPQNWSKNFLGKCQDLYLIHSKKDTINKQQWRSFAKFFGYQKNLAFIRYFKWYWEK